MKLCIQGLTRGIWLLAVATIAACGGGNEPIASPPTPSIQAMAASPVKKATSVTGGNGVVIHMYQALYGMAPSNALLTDYAFQANNDASTFVKNLTDRFATTSHADLANLVLDNLGVTASTVAAVNAKGESEYALLLDAVKQIFGAFPTMRGQVILNMTNLFAELESDATYGKAAAVYNGQARSNLAYSSNAANSDTKASSLQEVICSVQKNSFGEVRIPLEYLGASPIPVPTQTLPANIMRGIGFKDDTPTSVDRYIPLNKDCIDHALFERNMIKESLDRMQQDGAEMTWLINYAYFWDDFSTPVWTINKSYYFFPDLLLKFIVDEAAKRNIKVFLQWAYLSGDSKRNTIPTDGNFTVDSLKQVLDSYHKLLVEQAKYGKEIGLTGIEVYPDTLSINNLHIDDQLREVFVTNMVSTIKDVRQVFSGKITYSALVMDPRITSIIDSIVIFPFLDGRLTTEQANKLSVQVVKDAYLNEIKMAKNNYDYYMRGSHLDIPVIWRITNQSTREYYVNGWSEDCCCPTPACASLKLTTDYSAQAIGTEAAFQAIKEQTYFSNTNAIYFGDGYWFTDDMRPYQFKNDPSQYTFPNVSQNIRNKPAEGIVRYWFGH